MERWTGGAPANLRSRNGDDARPGRSPGRQSSTGCCGWFGRIDAQAARRIGPTGYALAADVSANMLNAAAEAARKEGVANIETRVVNAENIELDADSFDAVICRIALMLFPNPVKALGEMHRVVKPGGKVAGMVYSGLEKIPTWDFHETVRRLGNIPWPAPGEPWMYALGAPGLLEGVYSSVGFINVSVRPAPIPRRFPSAAAAVENMKKVSAGDIGELMNRLEEADRDRAWAEIEEKFKRFEGPNGFEAPGEVLIGVGTK